MIAVHPLLQVEALLDSLAATLDVPDSRYEAAESKYKSVGEWLRRPQSSFVKTHVDVYSQGSFQLGTAIRPVSDEEDYDLDVVCEIHFKKIDVTQAWLHERLGDEMKAYAKTFGMEPPKRQNRVWTLNYADGAQFHMDVLPSLPDENGRQISRKEKPYALDASSVAITDEKHPNYRVRCLDWYVSNPKGYADWFRRRMVVERARRVAKERASVSIDEIPAYKNKTPLQAAVQLLKRHRDMRFRDRRELRPSSIIITTLAAHAYRQEETISEALVSILSRMGQHVQLENGRYRIPNPTNEDENFADAWAVDPQLKDAFFDWLEDARHDFQAAANTTDPDRFAEILIPRIGRRLVEASVAKSAAKSRLLLGAQRNAAITKASDAPIALLDAPHRRPLPWLYQTSATEHWASIVEAICHPTKQRPFKFHSNSAPLPKLAALRFQAKTNVSHPYQVYWQIVNTGTQAIVARKLRGGFEDGRIERGHLLREENTRYSGNHSIQCFIVKQGVCVAKSELFVVNIE